MARTIPNTFLAPGEAAIASYSYTDIASGRGYVIFYAGECADGNILHTAPFYSSDVVQVVDDEPTRAAYTKVLDVDYDARFDRPRTIEGMGIVNCTVGIDPATNQNIYLYYTAKVRKWDGATETEIATNDSPVFNITTDTTASKVLCTEIDIPLEVFKSGESLRLTIELYLKNAGSASDVGFGQDPKDRDDDAEQSALQIIEDTDTTTLTFHCPFVIDI